MQNRFSGLKMQNAKHALGVTLAIAILILQFDVGFNISQSKPEIFGCDPLGYSRQARLFRTSKTIQQSLNTDLSENAYQHLKDWADSTSLNSSDWYQMIAPHCHHFRDSSGMIINQYPFGTGWLLSYLPEKLSRRWLVIISLACISSINIYKILGEQSAYQQVFRMFNVWALFKIVQEFWGRSDSLAPSILIATIAAEIALTFTEPNVLRSKRNQLYSLLLGLLLGFSICIRPGNLFFSFAAILCLLLAIAFKHLKKKEAIKIALIGGLGYLPGVLANGYFNWLNTGSPLQTTYTVIDTSFTDSFNTVLNNIQKITAEKGDVLIFIVACILLITITKLFLISRDKPQQFAIKSTIIVFSIAWTSLASFTLLCIFKNVFISYYLAAQVAFASSLICSYDYSPTGSAPLPRRKITGQIKSNFFTSSVASTSFILISFLIGIQNLSTTDELALTKNPLRSINPDNTLIWGDSAGSYLYWHYELPTAKISFGSREAQIDAINYLQNKGVNQYIMDENDLVSKLLNIKKAQKIDFAGEFRGIKIYKLNN